MLKACPYCGKTHTKDYVCPQKPQYGKHNAQIDRFRGSKAWRTKRAEIAQRDLHMCRLCAIGYGGQPAKYNGNISVHHIVPVVAGWGKRLDNDNLISLCPYHHELAERGKISQEYLHKVATTPPTP
jgi:predicted HNH restriction endonuclease